MTLPTAIAAGCGFLFFALILYVVSVFNELIRLKFNIEKAWANVDVLLKQRHDLVPNLVSVVSGVKDFEKGVMQEVAAMRAAAQQAPGLVEKSQAEKDLASSLNRLLVVAENYPQLKAQGNFLSLQKTLSGLEDEIADRRAFFNDSVAIYNARLAEFPVSLLAPAFNHKPHELFQATAAEKEPASVEGLRA